MIGWRSAGLAAGFVIAACERSPQTLGPSATEDGTLTINSQTGETRARVEAAQGPGTLYSGSDGNADLSSALPFGFTIYPGARVQRTTSTRSDKASHTLVTMRSADGPDAIVPYYRAQALKAGFSTEMDLATSTTRALDGTGPDGAVFSVNAIAQAGGTLVTLRLSSRPKAE